MKVELKHTEPLDKCTGGMGMCYGAKCSINSLVKAVSAGHLSLLEHANATFELECSQKCLAQITRHRHFSFTVESTRGKDITDNRYYELPLKDKELNDIISDLWKLSVEAYELLVDSGESKEHAAYVLPLMANVKFYITGNLRTWFEYLQKRLCNRASDEHKELALEIYKRLHVLYPSIFNTDVMGLCCGCKESSCDFTVHKTQAKNPIVKDIKEMEQEL
nr:MAG TPA: Thymidylate synthase complementing protein [Caudoviricetes sp.]